MVDQHIRAGFYKAASNVRVSELDHTLFTHLIFVPSAPLRLLNATFHFREEDLPHAATFADVIPPSSKALLALSSYPRQPAGLASSIEIARRYHFHGIHFTVHVINVDFLQFCARWREAAAQESRRTCRRPLLLTASFCEWSPQLTLPTGVPFPLDWLCLRGYLRDIHQSKPCVYSHVGAPFTFCHTALHDWKPYDTWSIHVRLRACLDGGVDPSHLVLGLAMHGFPFQLKDASVHGMHAPCIRQSTHAKNDVDRRRHKLPHLSQCGSAAYKHIREFIADHKAKYCHDSTTLSAYCYVGTTWIAYDDTFTITQKVDYIKSMGLKGYALDSLHEDTSDWHLSNAARHSSLGNVEGKQIINTDKGKASKGKQKLQSRARKEIIELGMHLSLR